MVIVSPSILSADFLNLERDIKRLESADANFIHIDIMDGVFVDNITWGPSTVSEIRKITSLTLDVHLMVNKPERIIDEYIKTKANIITIHPESTIFLRKTLLQIKNSGLKAGLALKLETPINAIENCLDLIDVVLLLTCDEGFGGMDFHPLSLEKISLLSKWRRDQGLDFKIEVDGGVNLETGKLCKEAGADILVSGSYIFKRDMKKAINLLKNV
ncbi:ribulose-phosphate 3-epimerase [Bacillus chungangensis]|uniref:Ribulose-phosphate 3-epimerase n=1 Tax=Bacillus chungangensis TaxID=587633 RepID=A0ABT9WVF3_9BACI|nr:ribulose-phosphate 3-epimerase [Bacillus chungangensis]